ncbi:DUF624 domain-containing protein [Halobacillus yeomjeoni]|uniref:YesL family protein n=1 Tax=Halobacillus yeomjeoni TaxID=311194 RepID=UPI001CD5E785|nr:DUF624 domain-containing protein [Halobacillus yeomjeoni]MCA0985519.1 DUF624 domain-containing protein [Halobacillus yeomjeoni]
MNQTSGVKGGLYAVSEWIMRFSLVNLQWALFNLPTALILISMLNSQSVDEVLILLVPLILFVPLTFFPATTAMFAKAREWVRSDQGEIPDQSYFYYYKQNYKTSLKSGFLFTILWIILAADIYYFSNHNVWMTNLFLIMGIILFVFNLTYFCVTVHYELKIKDTLKQSLLLTLTSPVMFLAMFISTGIILYLSLAIFPLLIPIFSGTIIAFLSFSAFYRLVLKLNQNH